jgi:Gpi18-like mannosyltransferase
MRSPETPCRLPPVILTLACALVAHASLWSFRGDDIDIFLLPWFEHIRSSGMIAAFSTPFSNYTPPYLYMLALVTPLAAVLPAVTVIKLLSVLGTVALAGSVWRLLTALDTPDPARGAALVLVLPSTLLNAPFLAQCDAMWAAACVMAAAMAVERRHSPMLVWFGLAIAFKLQAAFLGPFIVALLISRRVPLRLWLVAPFAIVATLLPAWAAGWPIDDLTTIYVRQAGYFNLLSLNAPNLWIVVQALPGIGPLPLAGLAITMAIGGSTVYVAWLSSRRITPPLIVPAALLATLLVVGLLPRMHERYFFLCDILALTLALTSRRRAELLIFALVQSASTLAILGYVLDMPPLAMLGAVSMIIATYWLARALGFPADPAVTATDAALVACRRDHRWSS